MFEQRDLSQPLFIDEVKRQYDMLESKVSQEVALVLTVDAKERYRCLKFRVPTGVYAKSHGWDIFERYIHARVNNMLVTFGGTLLQVYFDKQDRLLGEAIKKTIARYDVNNPYNTRQGLGCILNYISRMNALLGTERFRVEYLDMNDFCLPEGKKEFQIFDAENCETGEKLLLCAATELQGKAFCGLDIGGNSIKAAVVADGEIVLLKTYSWFPTFFTTAEQLIEPIVLLIRFMSAALRYINSHNGGMIPRTKAILDSTVSYQAVYEYTLKLEKQTEGSARVFDGIVIGFPDIVVNDKVAGGESYKQRGMRNNPNRDYEDEFRKQSDINLLAQQYIKENGIVKVINDGNVSSFVFSVEQAFADENIIEPSGMLAYTVGTEMGTGFVSRVGTIQWIPLECYNYIIDLGSDDYYDYDVNDVRSVRNFNSNAAGTVQKYISQIGMIRIAIQYLTKNDDVVYNKLVGDYLCVDEKTGGLFVVNKPKDMRSPLTRKLIALLENGNTELEKTFKHIGYCLGVVISEVEFIMSELSRTKLISGGIVMADDCFEMMKQGLKESHPNDEIKRLDTSIIYSPLLKKLNKEDGNYATAVGAAYLANRELLLKHTKEG